MPLYYRPAATISRTADRWYVSFTVEVQRAIPAGNGRDTVVGVDVGVRHLAVFSTGLATPNPVPSSARCASCDGSTGNYIAAGQALDAASRPDAGSRGVHARSANLRRDALHKLTTTLATQYGSVVVEQLNHKTGWYGSRLVVADRLSPSSKTCSACGWVKAKLALAERTFTCEACGLRVDRDLNAARNLATLAAHVARSGWETRNAVEPTVGPSLPGRWHEAGSRRPELGVRPARQIPARKLRHGDLPAAVRSAFLELAAVDTRLGRYSTIRWLPC